MQVMTSCLHRLQPPCGWVEQPLAGPFWALPQATWRAPTWDRGPLDESVVRGLPPPHQHNSLATKETLHCKAGKGLILSREAQEDTATLSSHEGPKPPLHFCLAPHESHQNTGGPPSMFHPQPLVPRKMR